MRTEDLILISVDDHVIEPRGMFDGLLPAKYQDKAPQLIRRPDETDYWYYDGNEIPNVGLNAVAGRPPEEYGIEPMSLDDMRVELATTSTSGCGTCRSTASSVPCASRRSPSSAVSCSPVVRTRTRPWPWCGPTTTWAHRQVVRGAEPGPFSSRCRHPGDLGSRAGSR